MKGKSIHSSTLSSNMKLKDTTSWPVSIFHLFIPPNCVGVRRAKHHVASSPPFQVQLQLCNLSGIYRFIYIILTLKITEKHPKENPGQHTDYKWVLFQFSQQVEYGLF